MGFPEGMRREETCLWSCVVSSLPVGTIGREYSREGISLVTRLGLIPSALYSLEHWRASRQAEWALFPERKTGPEPLGLGRAESGLCHQALLSCLGVPAPPGCTAARCVCPTTQGYGPGEHSHRCVHEHPTECPAHLQKHQQPWPLKHCAEVLPPSTPEPSAQG